MDATKTATLERPASTRGMLRRDLLNAGLAMTLLVSVAMVQSCRKVDSKPPQIETMLRIK